jgi:hypothetical protein
MESEAQCPYCGEIVQIVIDEGAGTQSYVEDCPVCCRPLSVQPFCFSGHADKAKIAAAIAIAGAQPTPPLKGLPSAIPACKRRRSLPVNGVAVLLLDLATVLPGEVNRLGPQPYLSRCHRLTSVHGDKSVDRLLSVKPHRGAQM